MDIAFALLAVGLSTLAALYLGYLIGFTSTPVISEARLKAMLRDALRQTTYVESEPRRSITIWVSETELTTMAQVCEEWLRPNSPHVGVVPNRGID